MSRKGKSRTRTARIDILRVNAANDRRRQRATAAKTARKSYDRQRYDKPISEES
jgi:hypothetical protein